MIIYLILNGSFMIVAGTFFLYVNNKSTFLVSAYNLNISRQSSISFFKSNSISYIVNFPILICAKSNKSFERFKR